MDELNELLRPSWGAEKWILEGWKKINHDEKQIIKERLYQLFKDGLPFEIKHDKLLYIYTFSLLAQLEVLAIQVPLRFEEQMSSPQFKQQMRNQLLDEIFHGMVFTKIVYLLCAPYNTPPAYNQHIEALCNFIRTEQCPKVGVVLLNLVAEGWIEEIFKSLHQQHIAPKVFSTILEDEHRHVCEADLYHELGLPAANILKKKLETLEQLLLNSFSLEPKYSASLAVLLGLDATQSLLQSMHEKHVQQLKKVNMVPSKHWQLLEEIGQELFSNPQPFKVEDEEIDMTMLRKVFMTQWNNPGDPTMVGQFNLDASCLDLFGKKFPAETLTTLFLQATSHMLSQEGFLRNFLSFKKMYQGRHAYVAIVVKLRDCNDHLGNIVFKNCHEYTVNELAIRIRELLPIMEYCYKKREEIEKIHPYLKHNLDEMLYGYAHDLYPYPMSGSSVVSVSNIRHCGYAQASSPLRKKESMKFTILTATRQPVWNNASKSFENRDLLPVSISADHRLYDGNVPIPRMLAKSFQHVFQQMIQSQLIKPVKISRGVQPSFTKLVDKMLAENLELGHRVLTILQNEWHDEANINEMLSTMHQKLSRTRFAAYLNEV